MNQNGFLKPKKKRFSDLIDNSTVGNIPPISRIGNQRQFLPPKILPHYWSGLSQEILPRQTPKKYPLSHKNGNTRAAL